MTSLSVLEGLKIHYSHTVAGFVHSWVYLNGNKMKIAIWNPHIYMPLQFAVLIDTFSCWCILCKVQYYFTVCFRSCKCKEIRTTEIYNHFYCHKHQQHSSIQNNDAYIYSKSTKYCQVSHIKHTTRTHAVLLLLLDKWRFQIPCALKHIIRHFIWISILSGCKVMMKMENGGHFGRHLEFRRELQGDSWGLLVCCSTHIPGPILNKFSLLWAISRFWPIFVWCSWTTDR